MAGATLRQAGGQPRRERARGATGSGACADRADDADADGDAVDRAGDVVVGGVLEVDLEAVAVAHAAQSDPADPGVARQGRTQTRLGVTCLLQVGHGSSCLLYTSDAADEEDSVDLGGRRIIKKKKTKIK